LHVEDVGGITSVVIRAGSQQGGNAYFEVLDSSGNRKWAIGQFGRVEIETTQTNYSGATHRHRHNSSGSFITFDSAGININDIFRALTTGFRVGKISDSGADSIFNITNTSTTRRMARWKQIASQTADVLTLLDSSDNELWGISVEGYQEFKPRDASAGSVVDVLKLGHNLNSGTLAVGMGAGILFGLESSTTEDTDAGRLSFEWADKDHSTRASLFRASVFSVATEQEFLAAEAASGGVKIGLNGNTPVAQSTGWSVSNVTTDKSFDADSTSLDEVADVLGTLITFLLDRGDIAA
jgi:hypothetical protein